VRHMLAVFYGALVGIANIIPGVSGGTFALVLGIYERLLKAIGAFGLGSVKVLGGWLIKPGDSVRRKELIEEFKRMDLAWLALLALGAGIAILASSRLISVMLEEHLAPTLAFFIGLIVPSIVVPYRLLSRKGWREALACVLGTGGIVALTFLDSGGTTGLGLAGLGLAGAVAISAMILPGVSGSFILMMLGEYKHVLDAINSMDFVRLGIFGLGCIVGLLAFVRLLNYLLKRFHSVTMAFLTGLIFGSLWVLWPFKALAPGAKIATGVNIWPGSFDATLAWSAAAFVLGLLGSVGMLWLGRTRPKSGGEKSES